MLIEEIDGAPPSRHPLAPLLTEAGFVAGAMGLQATFRTDRIETEGADRGASRKTDREVHAERAGKAGNPVRVGMTSPSCRLAVLPFLPFLPVPPALELVRRLHRHVDIRREQRVALSCDTRRVT